MHITDLILLVIESEGEKGLRGRTLLQKKFYFLSVLQREDLGFRPHYYGPYSSWLTENLDILASTGFIKEITETFSTDRNIFGEIRRHTYSLTDDGKIIMAEIQKENEFNSNSASMNEAELELKNWHKAIEHINSQPLANDFNKLSIAAKVHYILSEKGEATTEQVRQIASDYGWKLSESDIEKVLSFLEALSLISIV